VGDVKLVFSLPGVWQAEGEEELAGDDVNGVLALGGLFPSAA
jgi:hypothetical protein